MFNFIFCLYILLILGVFVKNAYICNIKCIIGVYCMLWVVKIFCIILFE